MIDNRSDFKAYMQNYAVARNIPRGPRRDGLYDEGYTPSVPSQSQGYMSGSSHISAPSLISAPSQFSIPSSDLGSGLGLGSSAQPQGSGRSHAASALSASTNTVTNGSRGNGGGGSLSSGAGQGSHAEYEVAGLPASGGATFGVDLTSQIARDSTEVPRVVQKCAECIEAYGTRGFLILTGGKLTVTRTRFDGYIQVIWHDVARAGVEEGAGHKWVSDAVEWQGRRLTSHRYRRDRCHVRAVVGGHQRRLGCAKAVVPRAARAALDLPPVPPVHRGRPYAPR